MQKSKLEQIEDVMISHANLALPSQLQHPYKGLPSIIAGGVEQAHLLNDYFDVSVQNKTQLHVMLKAIKMRTRPAIILNNVKLIIDLKSWNYIKVWYTQVVYDWKGNKATADLRHPHISGSGNPCYGTYQQEYHNLTQEYYGIFPNVLALVNFCIGFLRKYNVRSCYVQRDEMLPHNTSYEKIPGNINTMRPVVIYDIIARRSFRSRLVDSVPGYEDRMKYMNLYKKHIATIQNRIIKLGFKHILGNKVEPTWLNHYLNESFRARSELSSLKMTMLEDILTNDGRLPYRDNTIPNLKLRLTPSVKDTIVTIIKSLRGIEPKYVHPTAYIRFLPCNYRWIKTKEDGTALCYDWDAYYKDCHRAWRLYDNIWTKAEKDLKKVLDDVDKDIKLKSLTKITKLREGLINELSSTNYTPDDSQQSSLFAE